MNNSTFIAALRVLSAVPHCSSHCRWLGVWLFVLVVWVIPCLAQEYDLAPGKKILIKDSAFKQGSERLEEHSLGQIERLVKFLKDRPRLDIEIGGHADNQGNERNNVALSLARAETVKQFLVQRGIPAFRIRTEGYGSRFPLADNQTSIGQSQNRRVEIVGLAPISHQPLTDAFGKALQPEGIITSVQRQVSALTPWGNDWLQAQLTQPVYEYTKLNTLAQSRSEITFRDNSTLQIGENALVVVYGTERYRANPQAAEHVELSQGSLLLKLKQLRSNDTLAVRSKGAQMSFGQGEALITADAHDNAVVSVFEGGGNVRLLNPQDSTKTLITRYVPAAFGIKISSNALSNALPLPAPPELLSPQCSPHKTFVPVEEAVHFAWQSTTGTTRIEISDVRTFSRLLYGVITHRSSVDVALEQGRYFVKLSSIDSLGLESRSVVQEFVVRHGTVRRFRVLEFLLLVAAAAMAWWGLWMQLRILWVLAAAAFVAALLLFIVR